MRAFWGDTIHDAQVEPDGAFDGARADWQIMAQTSTGTYSPEHHKCATMDMVSVYNHESLSTFKHHNDPAMDWALVPKEGHPYDQEETERLEFLMERAEKGRPDPMQLRCEHLEVSVHTQTTRQCLKSTDRFAHSSANIFIELRFDFAF
jgi:hypothetical protein|eukprot:COSAG02_NODE_372_length_23640_cov_210.100463_7_plen_149_part_00